MGIVNAAGTGTARPHSLRVQRDGRGSWIVVSERGDVLAAHPSATRAEAAALAWLRDGDELVVVDCYHRHHRYERHDGAARPLARERVLAAH